MATTKEERAAIDAKVLAAMPAAGKGRIRAGQIKEATGLNFRQVDASLQRLKKAREAVYFGGIGSGWCVPGAKPKRKAAKAKAVDVATAFVPAGREPKKGDLLVANARAWKADRKAAKRGGA